MALFSSGKISKVGLIPTEQQKLSKEEAMRIIKAVVDDIQKVNNLTNQEKAEDATSTKTYEEISKEFKKEDLRIAKLQEKFKEVKESLGDITYSAPELLAKVTTEDWKKFADNLTKVAVICDKLEEVCKNEISIIEKDARTVKQSIEIAKNIIAMEMRLLDESKSDLNQLSDLINNNKLKMNANKKVELLGKINNLDMKIGELAKT